MAGIHLNLIRDISSTFPKIDDIQNVRSTNVWFCKYKTLTPLAMLTNLEELVISGFPDASLELFEGLEKLRLLHILDMPKIRDISPLARLKHLTSLSLSTLPSWDASRKTTTILSLEPLAAIPKLAHLELFGVCPPDKSLRPLENCKYLRTARISRYPQAEKDRFFRETGVTDKFNPSPSFT